ncbi:hypothetical protein [Aliirhizobium cellulosilyticum]|uniref:TnsA endonuclease N-terminal domain-containing protein n=1 Tax=Aliirhizobium cellulosilyticum TaxID=393664 RepID=A0A7W6Y1H8_9HYPH|nr:hypothetical protein [Rhizobium cellulosilyticum]MBB4349491.1 hypothetical protein [Rhizobium cellulosilyticum]MBB4412287.1 hypothetical protein [Rhizobium cellulosilyticum]MBB4446918.1 hypothetical protein [Rhizobium cellulosilyticum]
MRDETIVRRGVVLRHRLLERNRKVLKEANEKGVLPTLEDSKCLPSYERPRREMHQKGYLRPKRHGGVRNVARNSRKNERGFTIFNGREVQHESGLEHDVSLMLQADRTVAELYSQKTVAKYQDDEGVWRKTIFDYLVVKTDGSHIGIAVKPERYRQRILKIFEQIAMSSEETQIDAAIFMSNAQATRARVANARSILWARIEANPTEVEGLQHFLKGRKSIEFWELYHYRAVGNWARKAAIWRLIDLGVLEPASEYERIDDLTYLTVNL